MKYAGIFIFVFLLGFGILQWMNAEEEQTIESNTDPGIEVEIAQNEDTVKTVLETPLVELEPDTTRYQMKEGFYQVTWQHLSKVSFVDKMNEEYDAMVAYPVFQPSVKKLDGQKIQIKGYVIPLEETGDESIVILSAFPFTSCFFCGGAGPETVIDVQLKKQKTRFKQDDMISFRGKLRLNDSDLDYLNYILEEAEVYSE